MTKPNMKMDAGFSRIVSICLLTCFLFEKVYCDMEHDMGMDDTSSYTRPDIVDAGPRAFHWLCTLGFLLLLPSVVTCLSFAGRIYSATFLQCICAFYAFLEAAVFRFQDNDGVENRTSRGTAWFLAGLTWIALFFGGLAGGTGFLVRNKRLQTFISNTGETRLSYIHRGLSFLTVVTGWVKVCLAPVALFGFCREAHTGQCIAHGIMGSAFVLYGFIYVLVLIVPWIRNAQTSYSQDYIDSWVMCAWGIVNTFTEHRWGREGWSVHDYQHTFMGIIWWAGGILGILLSRNGRRTFVPSLIIIFTGWAMSEHAQHLIISTKVHNMFGLILMCGGALRILEISFLLKDKRTLGKIHSFQFLAPFCLVSSGILFMGANEEQLILVLRLGGDHSAYVLIILSGAFLVYFWMITCLEFYLYLFEKGKQGFLSKPYELQEENNNVNFELDNMSDDDMNEDVSSFNV
ncbi:ytp1p [Saccharomyces arboricola H-6]|uniref:Ytp1p n=1 Tax=Saccharomyces arboricola (strain H-6 / AS 2.3317 / CBS 10644) TaxID=1160507 RepID=J8LJ74_SACAR|nr:ytp1p [Saccharomyces arboricola H-6]